jgi:DnaJ-class molecular chaperone
MKQPWLPKKPKDKRPVKCNRCDGTGKNYTPRWDFGITRSWDCTKCGGKGFI